jgi:hypothetical protein
MQMSKRATIIRAALTRYYAGEQVRILAFVNDALDRERLRELDGDEVDDIILAWHLEVLPYGAEKIPTPILADDTAEELVAVHE